MSLCERKKSQVEDSEQGRNEGQRRAYAEGETLYRRALVLEPAIVSRTSTGRLLEEAHDAVARLIACGDALGNHPDGYRFAGRAELLQHAISRAEQERPIATQPLFATA